jgi:hypothetical protein
MNPSTPASAVALDESPRTSLSPVSDGFVTDSGNPSPTKSPDSDGSVVADAGGKKSHEIIFEAFGGERKFKRPFPPRFSYGPGFTPHRHALKRVSKKPPPHLSPADCLRFWGLEKNEATRGWFYLAENYERLFEGRIIAVNLGKKWITNLYHSLKPIASGEELNEKK